jgi:hypothetical protein
MKRALTTVLIAAAPALSVQEAQKHFPEWAALHDDLFATNQRLISYVGAPRNHDRAPQCLTDQTRAVPSHKKAETVNQRSVSGKLTAPPDLAHPASP